VVLLKKSVDSVDAETVVNNFNYRCPIPTTSGEDDSCDPATLILELLSLLDGVREVCEDEFVITLDA